MTQHSLTSLVEAVVPVRAMTDAIILANRLGESARPHGLLMLARRHGGDALMAQAIEVRLCLLALLLGVDPAFVTVAARLAPEQIAEVVATFPVRVHDGNLDFDGDALATALRLAAEPQGAA